MGIGRQRLWNGIRIISVFAVLFCSKVAYGQNDPQAEKILADVASKFKMYQSVAIDFKVIVSDLQDKSESEHQGKLWVKGNKYKLEIPEQEIYFDGTRIYQYMPEVKEVNVTVPDPNEEDGDLQLMNPQSILNISSKSFKSNLVKETTQDNRKVYEIDLYPVQLKTSQYSRIRLCVEKNTAQIVSLKAFLKNGTRYALSFSKYNVSQVLPDNLFIFDRAAHPEVEVIDLTF